MRCACIYFRFLPRSADNNMSQFKSDWQAPGDQPKFSHRPTYAAVTTPNSKRKLWTKGSQLWQWMILIIAIWVTDSWRRGPFNWFVSLRVRNGTSVPECERRERRQGSRSRCRCPLLIELAIEVKYLEPTYGVDYANSMNKWSESVLREWVHRPSPWQPTHHINGGTLPLGSALHTLSLAWGKRSCCKDTSATSPFGPNPVKRVSRQKVVVSGRRETRPVHFHCGWLDGETGGAFCAAVVFLYSKMASRPSGAKRTFQKTYLHFFMPLYRLYNKK